MGINVLAGLEQPAEDALQTTETFCDAYSMTKYVPQN